MNTSKSIKKSRKSTAKFNLNNRASREKSQALIQSLLSQLEEKNAIIQKKEAIIQNVKTVAFNSNMSQDLKKSLNAIVSQNNMSVQTNNMTQNIEDNVMQQQMSFVFGDNTNLADHSQINHNITQNIEDDVLEQTNSQNLESPIEELARKYLELEDEFNQLKVTKDYTDSKIVEARRMEYVLSHINLEEEQFSDLIYKLEDKADKLFKEKKYELAIGWYSTIIKTIELLGGSKNFEHYWEMISNCLYELGRYEEAMQPLDRMNALDSPRLYYRRGLVYAKLGNNMQAISDLTEFLDTVGSEHEHVEDAKSRLEELNAN